MAQSNNSNRLVVPGAQNAIDQMKYEIANEFVGGEITKRLVKMGQEQMSRSSYNNK